MKLKVCGLTQPNQVQELISLDVDFLGFIFYAKSPRYVLNHLNLKQISELDHSGKVGVFVNETAQNIAAIAEKATLNYIQLHGDEDENFIDELRDKLVDKEIKIIKVFRIGTDVEKLKFTTQNSLADFFLFDTDSASFGGTGKSFGWQLLNELEIQKPYLLSGGISPENFKDIHNIIQSPFALDINSKFETEPGVKDLQKIKQFYGKL
ncbi:Phosphoribosylanthranilate isomerase [Flavobacteriaceae bacterium 3519-10]|nr:Phosphoribosylanthranilate isomerase [Flavobacteriaceae bacterium 3519-10]